MKQHFVFGLFVAGLLGWVTTLNASAQTAELRERAGALRREAAELGEQGHHEEAGRLKREASELLELAERRERERERFAPPEQDELSRAIREREGHLHDLEAELKRLRDSDAPPEEQAEVREQFARVQRELEELGRERERRASDARRRERPSAEPEHRERIRAASERIEHILIAAEHLDAAGVHDVADELRRNAEQMKRDLQHAIGGLRARAEHDHYQQQIEELRNEVRRLREDMERLRREAEHG